MVMIDGLQYEATVTPIDNQYRTDGVTGVYVTFYPVDRPREFGEFYALHRTADGWEYVGCGKIRVSGNEPYGWILATREPHVIRFLVDIAEQAAATTTAG
jgi:hypothetical protein